MDNTITIIISFQIQRFGLIQPASHLQCSKIKKSKSTAVEIRNWSCLRLQFINKKK